MAPLLPRLNTRTTVANQSVFLESISVQGITSGYQDTRSWNVSAGVLFSEYDIAEGARVAIVGFLSSILLAAVFALSLRWLSVCKTRLKKEL